MGLEEFLDDSNGNISLFNILAFLYYQFTIKNEKDACEEFESMEEEYAKELESKYAEFLEHIYSASAELTIQERVRKDYIYNILEKLITDAGEVVLLWLMLRIESMIGEFSDCIYKIPYIDYADIVIELRPLNQNFEYLNIVIYPLVFPAWNVSKSNKKSTTYNINRCLNYYCIFRTDGNKYKYKFYYWNDDSIFKQMVKTKNIKIGISPVWNGADIETHKKTENGFRTIRVEGLINEEETKKYLKKAVEEMLERECQIIVFPEVIGSPGFVREIQEILINYNDHQYFIVMPTYYEKQANGEVKNKAVLLTAAGYKILEQNKLTSFFLHEDEKPIREEITEDDTIRILQIKGLGGVVISICADILENSYIEEVYHKLPVHTLLIPSYSPGIGGFNRTLAQGFSEKTLSVWINTCSVDKLIKNNYKFEPIGLIQTPYRDGCIHNVSRRCNGICQNPCFFEIIYNIENGELVNKHNVEQ